MIGLHEDTKSQRHMKQGEVLEFWKKIELLDSPHFWKGGPASKGLKFTLNNLMVPAHLHDVTTIK